MAGEIKREVRVGMMGGSARCRLCGCKPVGTPSTYTMVQVTVTFPALPELGQRFTAICEPCAVALLDALGKPAA